MAVKVLLVEDNDMNRDMLSRRLRRSGFEVNTAVNGAEVFDRLVDSRPDIILMDLSLPVMDGWEATKKLKSFESTREIPVIALTAHALNSDKEGALHAGCDDFDVKPVDFQRLLGKIDALVK